jgi:hypothetical protein
MTSLGTDFKTHGKWQRTIEKPTAKDFVARKVCTIKLNEVQGTHWNANKCKERLGNCPEAVLCCKPFDQPRDSTTREEHAAFR